jgi:metal-sulfur cluster biosynthetic enzyme
MNTTSSTPLTTIADVRAAMKTIYDPEIGINVIDLGLVYDVQIKDAVVSVSLTLMNPGCPLSQVIETGIRTVVCNLPGIKDCIIQLVWHPPWNPSMISEEGRQFLGISLSP